MPTTGCL